VKQVVAFWINGGAWRKLDLEQLLLTRSGHGLLLLSCTGSRHVGIPLRHAGQCFLEEGGFMVAATC